MLYSMRIDLMTTSPAASELILIGTVMVPDPVCGTIELNASTRLGVLVELAVTVPSSTC